MDNIFFVMVCLFLCFFMESGIAQEIDYEKYIRVSVVFDRGNNPVSINDFRIAERRDRKEYKVRDFSLKEYKEDYFFDVEGRYSELDIDFVTIYNGMCYYDPYRNKELLSERKTRGKKVSHIRELRSYLKPGDIIVYRDPKGWEVWGIPLPLIGKYSHSMIVASVNGSLFVHAPGTGLKVTYGKFDDVALEESVDGKKGITDISILRVRNISDKDRHACASFCGHMEGHDYSISVEKENFSLECKHYCSQLVWQGYHYMLEIDIDGDGGSKVFPGDIYKDEDTEEIVYWEWESNFEQGD